MPHATREIHIRMAPTEQSTAVALQEQVCADYVLHRSRPALTDVVTWSGQQWCGVLDVVGLDDLMSPRAHRQLLHGGDVEPGEHDPFGDGQVMGDAVPAGHVELDVPLGDVRAVGLHGRVGGDTGEDEPRLLKDLAGDRFVERLAGLGPAADQGPGARITDRLVRIPQVKEVLAAAVDDQDGGTCGLGESGRVQRITAYTQGVGWWSERSDGWQRRSSTPTTNAGAPAEAPSGVEARPRTVGGIQPSAPPAVAP